MSKVLKRLYLGDVVKSFGTKQLRKLTTEEPTESIVGTWIFNDVISMPDLIKEFNGYLVVGMQFSFPNANDTKVYSGFRFNNTESASNALIYSRWTSGAGNYLYKDGAFVSDRNVIDIMAFTGEVTCYNSATKTYEEVIFTESDLLSWLKANATKQ